MGVRAIVLGTGFIGAVHAEAIRRAGSTLLGMLGSSPERGAQGAARIGTRSYADLSEVLASDADVVHVATPNVLHADQTRALLAAGKHVVCEKPLATTLADAAEMTRLAEASGLVNATCFNFRFYPLLPDARARVARGDMGAVHLVTGSYLQDWLLKPTDWNWRVDEAVGGSTRAMADIGSHWLDLAQYVTGSPVVRVLADLQTVHRTRHRPAGEVETFSRSQARTRAVVVGTDDAASVLLRFGDGAHGTLTVSQVSAGRKNDLRLEISGAEGTLAWASGSPDELWVGYRDAPNQVVLRDPTTLDAAGAAVSFYPAGHVEGFGETFRGLVERVHADVASGGPRRDADGQLPYPTFRDGLRGLAVDDAIRRSAATGTWTDVERTL